MTTLAQTVLALDELAATYRVELDQGDPERWHRVIGKFEAEHVFAAVAALQETPTQFMPNVGQFCALVRNQARAATAPDEDCGFCSDHRWVPGESLTDGSEVYETVKPCGNCSPLLLEAARSKRDEMAKGRRKHGADTLLPYRVSDVLEKAREGLRNAEEDDL
jgi:hypothetical protein